MYKCLDCNWEGPESDLVDGTCPECGSSNVEEMTEESEEE